MIKYRLKQLAIEDCSRVSSAMSEGSDITTALKTVGPACLADGIWRLFSESYPCGGIDNWNTKSAWRAEWGIAAAGFRAFGEDLFGNQLIVRPDSENVFLWNHENSEQYNLLLEPTELFEVILESGLDWIDLYYDGSLAVARNRIKDVSLEQHLHWNTPLILGGPVTVENTSLVERTSHLVGHGKLWRQVGDLPPGSSIVLR